MKKSLDYTTSKTSEGSLDKNIELDKIKTTNVNILLNRVRLDQKRIFKKRIVFSTIIVTLVILLAVYFSN